MGQLHLIDLLVMLLYFAAMLWIGVWIMRAKKKSGECESFLAADRDMGLLALLLLLQIRAMRKQLGLQSQGSIDEWGAAV